MARVQVRGIIVGTGGQVFISLGTPNVRGGQRDRGVLRGSEEGTRVPVVYIAASLHAEITKCRWYRG